MTTNIQEKLKLAKFHNSVVFATSVSRSGSKKIAKKGIPDSNKQKIEDLGNNDDVFKVTGFIAARFKIDSKGTLEDNPTYFEMRDSLVTSFRSGFGLFVNPFGDDILEAICVEWEFTESESSLGLTPISFTLETSSIDEIVSVSVSSIDEVETKALILDKEINADLAGGLKTTFSANFTDAVAKASSAITKIRTSVGPIEAALDQLDSYQENISSLLNDVNGLIASPQSLADGLTNAIQGVADLQSDFKKTFSALVSMFDFGDLDILSPFKTASAKERLKNKKLINRQVQLTALSNAYVAAVSIGFSTIDEIDDIVADLEIQFDKVEKSEALLNVRLASQAFFDSSRVEAHSISTIESHPTSTKLLAYQYYGSSDLGDKIANLNGFKHADDVSGDVDIFAV